MNLKSLLKPSIGIAAFTLAGWIMFPPHQGDSSPQPSICQLTGSCQISPAPQKPPQEFDTQAERSVEYQAAERSSAASPSKH